MQPSHYHLLLSTDIGGSQVHIFVQFYDEEHEPVGESITRDWSTFCFTWQDLVHLVESWYQEVGGVLNDSLNRPSPFVDLT